MNHRRLLTYTLWIISIPSILLAVRSLNVDSLIRLFTPQADSARLAQISARVHYVDRDATDGAGTGLSWTDAFTSVQEALIAAQPGDEIWVAEGLYKPTTGLTPTISFQLLSGVALYGGFVGTETLRTQRDWTAHVTVLSGDIDNNDITDPNGVVVDRYNINGYNSNHVVNSSGVDATAVLDGFIITAGDGTWGSRGGGLYNLGGSPQLANVTFSGSASEFGAGMYNQAGFPTLTDVTFTGNYAMTGGGGMYNHTSSPTLTHVIFSNNEAGEDGGGMYNHASSPSLADVIFSSNHAFAYYDYRGGGGMYNNAGSQPVLTNVTFNNNSSPSRGGGMYNAGSSPTLLGVVFSGNHTDRYGGGMYNDGSHPTLINTTFDGNSTGTYGGGMYNTNSRPTIINTVFSDNSATGLYTSGGAMINWDNSDVVLINVTVSNNSSNETNSTGGISNQDSSPALINCIVWGNSGSQIAGNLPSIISYSLVQDGCPTGSSCDHILSDNPQFAAGLRLQDTSPAIDAGDSTAVPADSYDLDGDEDTAEPVPYDLAGSPRLVDHYRADSGAGGAPLVDMGAYEAQGLSLHKAASAFLLDAGDLLTYSLTFQNNFGLTATQVLITDIIPIHLHAFSFINSGAHITPTGSISYTWQVEDLSPGEGGIITLTGVLSSSLLPGHSFANLATFSGVVYSLTLASADSVTVARDGVDLAVAKRADRDPAVTARRLAYTLTITNHSPFEASQVVLTDTLPGGVSFISTSPGCNAIGNGDTVTCSLASLAGQTTAAFTIVVTAPTTVGPITNTASLATISLDPDLGNNTAIEKTYVSAEADLALTKLSWPNPVLAGRLLTYTLVVTNHGPDIAGGVVLSDALPAGLTYAGRLLALPLNEAEGAVQFGDVSGFGHHGICDQQAEACPTAGVRGLYDYVLDFDGANDWLESADFDIDDDFSLSLWVYPLSDKNGQAFISKHTASGGNLVVFGFYDDGYAFTLRNATYQGGTKTTDAWQHLVVIGREIAPSITEVTVYRDAQLLWQHELGATMGDVTGKGWAIGQEWDGGSRSDFFEGAMDEVSIYNRALSEEEIAALYAGHPTVHPIASRGTCALGSGLMCSLGTLAPGEVASITFPVRLNLAQTGTLTNTASVSSYVPDPVLDNNNDEASNLVGGDLAVSKADALDPVMPGERLIYTLTITRHNPTDVIATLISNTAANPAKITIPASTYTPTKATLYPSSITVSGLTGTVIKVTATLYNITHRRPNRLDALLVGPGGQSVILISDVGYFEYSLYDTTLTFDDDAPGFMPDPAGQIPSGTYRPTNYTGDSDSFPSPAPGEPYGAAMSVFDRINPNGEWSLYVVLDEPYTEAGAIDGGWSLTLWTASSGTVTDVLPEGVTFASASPGCSESSGTVTCILEVLADQPTTTLTIAVTAPLSVGLITNTASLVGVLPDLNPANNTTIESTWVSAADLAVDKAASSAILLEGDTTAYTVTLVNHGPLTAAGIVISDALPVGISFGGYTASQGVYTSTTGAWHVDVLAAGSVATLTITGTLDAGTAGQTLTNTAALSASAPVDIVTHNNADSASLTVASPNLAVVKTVEASRLAGVPLGSLVTYTIAIKNDAAAATANVVMTDPLPGGVTFGAWVERGQGMVNLPLRTVEWGPHDVAAHTAYTISFTANVTNSADFAGQTITNTAHFNSTNAGSGFDSAVFAIRRAGYSVYLPLLVKSYQP